MLSHILPGEYTCGFRTRCNVTQQSMAGGLVYQGCFCLARSGACTSLILPISSLRAVVGYVNLPKFPSLSLAKVLLGPLTTWFERMWCVHPLWVIIRSRNMQILLSLRGRQYRFHRRILGYQDWIVVGYILLTARCTFNWNGCTKKF